MSKERARRRAEREREAAIRRAARAARAERRERRQARSRTLRAATVGRVRRSGRPTGVLARRHQQQTTGLVAVLVLLNLVVWVVRGDWPAVLGALVVSLLVYPVLKLLLFARH